jgi:hypothetical protein
MRLTRYAAVSVLALAVVTLAPAARPTTVTAQEGGQAPEVTTEDVGPAAGFFGFFGGGVRGLRARTQTAASSIASPGAWVALPGAILAWTVPSGTSDTFDVSFTAECSKILGGVARIRLIDTTSGSVVALEPNDNGRAFCSASAPASYHADWIRRAGAGTHNLQVQFNNTAGVVSIDDWKMTLVVYD